MVTLAVAAVPTLVAGACLVRLVVMRGQEERYESHAHVLRQLKKLIDSPEPG
jgi:hypothetical protein